MVAPNKYTLVPSPVGPFAHIDLVARVVFGLIWDRYRLSVHSHLRGDQRWLDEDSRVYCVYAQDELARHAGISDRTVRRCLDDLRRAGLLSYSKAGLRGVNRYYVELAAKDYLGAQRPGCQQSGKDC